jgi:hypothetical protein
MKPSSIKGKSQVFVRAYFFFLFTAEIQANEKKKDLMYWNPAKYAGKNLEFPVGGMRRHQLIYCLVLPAHSLCLTSLLSFS